MITKDEVERVYDYAIHGTPLKEILELMMVEE